MLLPPRSVGLIVFESSMSAILLLSAFFGNSILLVALYRKPRLRSSTGIMIAALAVTDLLNACIPGSLFFYSLATGNMTLDSFGCQMCGFFLHFLTYASMSTMALSAINRFFCVLKPHAYKRVFTYRRSLVYILSLWLFVAVVVFIPVFSGWATFAFNPLMASCILSFADPKMEVGYTSFIVGFFVVLCLGIITFCYIRVLRFIRQHNANTASLPTQEIHLTKALFVLVFTFAVLWIPAFLTIVLFRLILRTSRTSREMVLVVPYLMSLSSALNPWIYGVMSPLVRNKMKKSFFKPNSVQPPETSTVTNEITVMRAWERSRGQNERNSVANVLPNVSS